MNTPYHWHPNQDYCLKCQQFVRVSENTKQFYIKCQCSIAKEVHGVMQQIHVKCLNEIKAELGKEKIFGWEMLDFLGIKEPIT
jgi:hypothetical protein